METGVAGLSIEESSGDSDKPLYDIDEAVARMRAARAAIDRAGGDVLLTGRAECFLVGRARSRRRHRRLRAYADAGADCLYAPGIKTREQIAAVVKAVAPKPVNFLIGGAVRLHRRRPRGDGRAPHQRRRRAGALGLVRLHAQREADRRDGRFDGFARPHPAPELNKFFSEDRKQRALT